MHDFNNYKNMEWGICYLSLLKFIIKIDIYYIVSTKNFLLRFNMKVWKSFQTLKYIRRWTVKIIKISNST